MITFKNIHGLIEVEKGLRYKFTIVEVDSGDVWITADAEVVGEDEVSVLVKFDKKVEKLEKVNIVETVLYEETALYED